MVENKSTLFGIIAITIGACGLGLGAFAVVNFQVVEGPQGLPGEDGQDGTDGIDGEDAPGGIVVGIMDPDYGEIISGDVIIRAMITGSEDYAILILRNNTEIGTSLPMTWNTETIADGWWNITIIATDIATNSQSQDEIVVYVKNVEDSTNIYYCSSQSEIEKALDTIDTGHGIIFITENITLSTQININNGGNYIIQGAGSVTLDRNANDETFLVTHAQSLILKDLIIDTTDITSETVPGIALYEANDNPVYLENVQIHGGNGRGININSEEVWVENCIIYDVRVGISLMSSSAYCHILDNSLFELKLNNGDAYGIYIYNSDYNTISGNIVYDITSGINAYGIYIYNSDYNTISGNIIYNITSGIDACGVYTYASAFNIIGDNVIHKITADIDACGVYTYASAFNIIGDNVIYEIYSNGGYAIGIWLYISDYNSFTSNVIREVIRYVEPTRYGIYGTGDHNVIVGNVFSNCGTSIDVTGTSNVIDNNVV